MKFTLAGIQKEFKWKFDTLKGNIFSSVATNAIQTGRSFKMLVVHGQVSNKTFITF